MKYTKLLLLAVLMLLATGFSPLLAQNNNPAPSKFEMKKDGDGDGVKNKRDKCPSTPPGVLVDGTGCPVDTDKDSVPDYLDKCPSLPGTEAMNGCQDKDSDGVSDFDDHCADVPGLSRFKGCPDSDGDGMKMQKINARMQKVWICSQDVLTQTGMGLLMQMINAPVQQKVLKQMQTDVPLTVTGMVF